MLDPEYLERAGTLVGSVYSQIEAEMCDQLVRDMLAGDISDWHDQRILALLAQGEAPKLRAILEQHRGDVDEAVRREVEEALERSDAHDLRVLKEALGVDLPGIMPMQVMSAVRTVTQMLERDNVAMLSGARDLFYNQSAWAVTQAATGVMGYDEAIRRAIRELARKGIDVIQYKDPQTGNLTVRSAADVAVTRHVRSQLSQQCSARTMQVCRDVGCEFVEVSSHFGARPSHQDWEGRRYHVGGRVTVDGVTYEDFGEATGYYGTGGHGALGDRLCGVNCRHQFGPWMPGMPHAYEPNPQHPSGKSNEEIYRLTQQQRRLERAIRASKREVAAAERAYEADPTLKNQTTANQLREQLRKRQDALAKLVDENKDVLTRDLRREYAGDMPRVKVPEGSARSMSEFLMRPSVSSKLESEGVTLSHGERALTDALESMGIKKADFKRLTPQQQEGAWGRVQFRRKGHTHRIIGDDGQQVITKALLSKIRKRVERRGGQIITANDEQMEYLRKKGASAATFGDVAIITPQATTSDVLEEARHIVQNIEGMNQDKPADLIQILNEIDAKEYLLRNARQYNIPQEETDLTAKQLEGYRRKLEEYRRRTGWHE